MHPSNDRHVLVPGLSRSQDRAASVRHCWAANRTDDAHQLSPLSLINMTKQLACVRMQLHGTRALSVSAHVYHVLQMYNAPGLYRLQAVGDHIRAFDVQVASPEDVADEVRCIGRRARDCDMASPLRNSVHSSSARRVRVRRGRRDEADHPLCVSSIPVPKQRPTQALKMTTPTAAL